MTVARDLDEEYPDFFGSFVTIVPMFEWQEDLLKEWKASRIQRLELQGGSWIISSLSQSEKYLLAKYGISYEKVVIPIDPMDD